MRFTSIPLAFGLVGSDMQLARIQTIMSGAIHCDFRFKMKAKES